MKNPDSSSVRDLSSGQVRSLLSVGLSSHRPRKPESDASSAEDIMAADPKLLAQVIEDLKTPCPDKGPFSIFRLCNSEPANSECFSNQSWLQLLTLPATGHETLQQLMRVGQLLGQLEASDVTTLTGNLIRLLASEALETETQGSLLDQLSESQNLDP